MEKINHIGGNKMEATMLKTNVGNGYKIVVDGVWFYTTNDEFNKLVKKQAKACKFRTIEQGTQVPALK